MINLPSFHEDSSRVAALMRYRDLDYSNSPEFKIITQLAADICNVPIALVSFVDTNDVKLRFVCGLDGASSIPRDISFCHHTVMEAKLFEVPDTTKDPRFQNSPLVVNDPKFRFYTGIPILTHDSYAIGALCVMDYKPNKLTAAQKRSLFQLSKIISKSLESKLLEAEKRKQEAQSRLFFNHAPVCIHGIDMQGCFTSMNPSGLKMLGLKSDDEIKGVHYLQGVAEKDYDRIKHLLENALQGEKSTFEFTGTGGKIYSSCFVPIKNDQGDVIKLMGISENITVRKHAEKKLEKEMERLELVMRATNDCVWDVDNITNTVLWNESYTNTFGRLPEENTREWWIERLHPEDRERVRDSYDSAPETGAERWDAEYRFKTPDGSYAYIQDRGYIARDETGKATRILGAMRDITESKRTEQDLREMNIALSHSLPGIARLDPSGYYTYVNESYADMLGYTPEELTGQTWKMTVVPNDIKTGISGYKRMLKEDKVEFDLESIRKDGSPIFKHVLIAKHVDDNGDFIGLNCFIKDITEQKCAEQDLLELNMALSNSLPGISRLDTNGCYTHVNESYAGMVGYTPDELIGQSWKVTVDPNDIEMCENAYQRMLEEENVEIDFRGIRKDGSRIFQHALLVKRVNEKGEFIGYHCFHKDINEQKCADQDLRELNMALSYSLPGIARINPDGCYTYVNAIYAGLLGYTPEELIGHSWKVTVDPNDIEMGESNYQRMLEEENIEFDIKGIRKDGSSVFKHVLISKRLDDDGYFIGHLCFMKDITDQIQAEKQHKQLQDELTNIDRLSNMDELATSLAHELNQPLTAISHYCDAAKTLLASKPIASKTKLMEIIDAASEQVHRTGGIIRHCRQLASKQPMDKCDVNLNELTQETVRYLASDALDYNVSIQVTLDKNLPPVELDKVQIQQVLVNLIRNGLEAMENVNGSMRNLTVCTHLNGINATKPEVEVMVTDTGSGIENEQSDKLFQPFYSTKTNGMGLGLSISRSIIEAHGGKLWAERQDNKETQFHFTLPLNRE